MNYADWYTDRMTIRRVKSYRDGGLTRQERHPRGVRPGDELLIYRGRGLGQIHQPIRAFAGEPVYYHEPFGAVMPGLAHQEIVLLQKEYLDAEVKEDGAG